MSGFSRKSRKSRNDKRKKATYLREGVVMSSSVSLGENRARDEVMWATLQKLLWRVFTFA